MNEAESLGVESLTRQKFEAVLNELTILCIYGTLADFSSIITFVIEKRMTYPVEMHPDLVSTSCFKTAFNYSNIAEAFQNPVMSHCMLSMITIREYLEAHAVIRITSDVSYDSTFVLLEITPDDGHITALDRMHEELFCEIEL